MEDLFDNVVMCKECNKKMEKTEVERNGFKIRALECPQCSKRIFHPADTEEYKKFSDLKDRQFHVKLRLVGNSYTVSIPREIVNFIQDTEKEIENERKRMHERMSSHMQSMVTLAMEEMGKLSLMFGEQEQKEMHDEKILKKRQK